MTALPSLDTCGLRGTGLNIWHTLLQAENTVLKDPSRTEAKFNDPLIGIRLLGFFLQDFWDHAHDGYLGSNPYARMVTEITSCLNEPDNKAIYDALVELGLRYRYYLLQFVPTQEGRILKELGNVPQTKPNVRKQALLRDGYRCAISGVYDMQSCLDIDEIDEASKALDNPMVVETEVAHIFSESAQDGDKDYAATVFAILEMFGLGNKAKALYGGEVNSLQNVITMAINLHSAFDSFNLWLEPVPGQENTYDVCGRLLGRYPVPTPSRVTFSVEPSAAAAAEAMNKKMLLPDPVLIAVRAACARVANLFGAAEQVDRILRDLEDIIVLADDGSMAELLSSRLSTSTPRFVDVHG